MFVNCLTLYSCLFSWIYLCCLCIPRQIWASALRRWIWSGKYLTYYIDVYEILEFILFWKHFIFIACSQCTLYIFTCEDNYFVMSTVFIDTAIVFFFSGYKNCFVFVLLLEHHSPQLRLAHSWEIVSVLEDKIRIHTWLCDILNL